MKNFVPILLNQKKVELPYGTTSGKLATASGFAEYHWHDMSLNPITDSSNTTVIASGSGLRASQEWGYNQLSIRGDRLEVSLDAETPDPLLNGGHNGSDDGNKRAEVYTTASGGSFTIENPVGTTEWIGFNVRFGFNYNIDTNHPFGLLQSKPNDENGNNSPPLILQISGNNEGGSVDGELMVVITANSPGTRYNPTGIVPVAGSNLDIVLKIVHEQGTAGAVKLWVNGNVVYDENNIPTMYTPSSGAGTLKWGAYKWRWATQSNINESKLDNAEQLNLSYGPVRIDTTFVGDATYNDDKYELVRPR